MIENTCWLLHNRQLPMKLDSFEGPLLCIGSIIAGSLLILFHQSLRERHDRWNESVPWFLRWSPPNGKLFSIFLFVFAAFLIPGGVQCFFAR
jgi:hypothetical protein